MHVDTLAILVALCGQKTHMHVDPLAILVLLVGPDRLRVCGECVPGAAWNYHLQDGIST